MQSALAPRRQSGKACIDLFSSVRDTPRMRLNSLSFDALAARLTNGSFDLNLQAAGIRIEETWDLLAQACARCVIEGFQFQVLFRRIKQYTLGHLCGGINREGSDFLKLYRSVERL
ncbi:MAG: hypothetical protein U1A72_20060 [Sulfuritalea sp.]|nr:hypothetical protein [Sulfuritalea sp.]